jgi:hypothetical protein
VADRHPVLAHGLDDRWDIGMGVPQKFLGLGDFLGESISGCPWSSTQCRRMDRSRPWLMLRVSSSGAQADNRGCMAAWNPRHQGRASTSPFGLR